MRTVVLKTETSVQFGETAKKYIFKTKDGKTFEASSFWQPELNRYDLCISSMSGCLMGCKICECTYQRLGNEGLLSASEIFYQIKVLMDDAVDFIITDKQTFPKITDYKFDTEMKFNSMVARQSVDLLITKHDYSL